MGKVYFCGRYLLGSSPGTQIIAVENYSALPDPTTVTGRMYLCINPQGDKYIPGWIGGADYYNAGIYYSNGVIWEYPDTPYQATLSQVNAGINNSTFLTPYTFANSNKIVNSFQKNVDTTDNITEGTKKFFTYFEFTQAVASTVWSVAHNLGRKPNVALRDSSNVEMIGKIVHIDLNNLEIRFNTAKSGNAYLN